MAIVINFPVQPKYPIGIKIYYRGDMANIEGWFLITEFVADKWGKHYTLTEIDGEAKSVDDGFPGGRVKKMISEAMISDVDKGNGLTPFVTEEAYNTFRNQQLEALNAAAAKYSARRRE